VSEDLTDSQWLEQWANELLYADRFPDDSVRISGELIHSVTKKIFEIVARMKGEAGNDQARDDAV
jgi:hypothetical protein